jgi:hypothetical protein
LFIKLLHKIIHLLAKVSDRASLGASGYFSADEKALLTLSSELIPTILDKIIIIIIMMVYYYVKWPQLVNYFTFTSIKSKIYIYINIIYLQLTLIYLQLTILL